MKTKAERDAYMAEVVKKMVAAYTQLEGKRDRAAKFIFNNFEDLLSMIQTDNDVIARNDLKKLRKQFYLEEQAAGFIGDVEQDDGCAGCLTATEKHPCLGHGCKSWCGRHKAAWLEKGE